MYNVSMSKTEGGSNMGKSGQDRGTVLPPYISFSTFLNVLGTFSEQGIPAQVDTSVLRKFSGSVQRQLLPALRFMGFTDEHNTPTVHLVNFSSEGEEERKKLLADILKSKFSEQVKILPNGTQQQLRNSFEHITAEPSVKGKCLAFFLKAAQYAGLEVSRHITQRMRVARGNGNPTKRRRKVADRGPSQQEGGDELPNDPEKISVPIPLGPEKVWKVIVDRQYSQEDLERFAEIVKLVLGKGGKE